MLYENIHLLIFVSITVMTANVDLKRFPDMLIAIKLIHVSFNLAIIIDKLYYYDVEEMHFYVVLY